jgi:succinyl-diaminopimelate desuccinylase
MTESIELLSEKYARNSIELCQELVKIPSEDPPGNTIEIAAFIEAFFRKQGIDCRIVSPHKEKPSVVARIEGNGKGKNLIFNGHIDTFPVGDCSKWMHDPFGGELCGGKLYGRGASDMKGGVAAMLTAASVLNSVRDEFPGSVTLTCVSDEEVNGDWGTRYLLKEFPSLYGDALINAEPSSIDHIRIGEKGIFQVKVTVDTRGGHGAYAGLRDNAIEDMINLLGTMTDFQSEMPEITGSVREMMERARDSYDKILSSGATDQAISSSINIGTVSGGIMVNMVPEHCSAEIDFRLAPGVSCAEVEQWLKKKTAPFPNASYSVIKSTDAFLTDIREPIVRCVKEVAEEVRNAPAFENYSLGGTEAVLWRAKGVPAVTYGPNHHNMGSPDEYIYADELPVVAKVHAIAAWRYLTGKSK